MKSIAISALVVALTGGTALADRSHGRPWSHHGSHSARTWSDATKTWSGGVRVQPNQGRWRAYDGHRSHYMVSRRPIFVRAPIIRQRYFDVRYRPQVVVENYAPIAGYYWINGRWDWNGAEWQWTAGHYEPEPTYGYPSYSEPPYAPSEPSCDHDYQTPNW